MSIDDEIIDDNLETNEDVTTQDLEIEEEGEGTPPTPAELEQEQHEEKLSLIDSIKEKLGWNKTKEVEEETKETIVPDVFLEAATKAGFTTDQINQLAKDYSADQLKDLIPHLLEEPEEEVEEETEEETKETVIIPENLKEELKPFIDEIRKEYESRDRERSKKVEELHDRLLSLDADKAMQEVVGQAKQFEKFLDRASENFPVFGKLEELPRYPASSPKAGQLMPIGTAYESRKAVWDMAVNLNKLGESWDDSLDDALAWYKGKFGEKEISKKLVKDLKSQEQRLSARRSSKQTKKTFTSEHEEKLSIIEEAKRKAGIA